MPRPVGYKISDETKRKMTEGLRAYHARRRANGKEAPRAEWLPPQAELVDMYLDLKRKLGAHRAKSMILEHARIRGL